jgi:ribosomal protein S18 acetylase RimI-like enzyme
MVSIRPFEPADHPALRRIITELQTHIASLDPLQKVRKPEDFDARRYVDVLLKTLDNESGILLVAKENGILLGFIAGSIPPQIEEDLLDHYPTKEGKIHELVVSEKRREKGIGRMLIEKLEEQFRIQGCEYVRVGCFVPNTGTHAFYEKCGYSDRYVEMLKQIS